MERICIVSQSNCYNNELKTDVIKLINKVAKDFGVNDQTIRNEMRLRVSCLEDVRIT